MARHATWASRSAAGSAGIRAALVLGGLLLFGVIGEVGLRVYQRAARVGAVSEEKVGRPTSPLGWTGRRVWGDPATPRSKLLVIGDSMTAGRRVAEADLYPVVLGRLLNVEVFAYGGSGYGTLQESMVLDEALRGGLRPDVTVLQVLANDFINNVWSLESRSYINNNLRDRPYLEADQVVRRFPSSTMGVRFIAMRSRLGYFLLSQVARVQARLATSGFLESIEATIARDPGAVPDLLESVAVTERIIAGMRGRTRLVLFVGDELAPYFDLWRDIARRQGVPILTSVPGSIVVHERRLGTSLRRDEAHWNARGHAVVAQELARWLREDMRAL